MTFPVKNEKIEMDLLFRSYDSARRGDEHIISFRYKVIAYIGVLNASIAYFVFSNTKNQLVSITLEIIALLLTFFCFLLDQRNREVSNFFNNYLMLLERISGFHYGCHTLRFLKDRPKISHSNIIAISATFVMWVWVKLILITIYFPELLGKKNNNDFYLHNISFYIIDLAITIIIIIYLIYYWNMNNKEVKSIRINKENHKIFLCNIITISVSFVLWIWVKLMLLTFYFPELLVKKSNIIYYLYAKQFYIIDLFVTIILVIILIYYWKMNTTRINVFEDIIREYETTEVG